MEQVNNAEKDDTAVNLAKQHLQKLELASGFVLVALYGSRVDVVMKGNFFETSGMLEIAKQHAMENFERATTKS